jgi:hypothetical protein
MELLLPPIRFKCEAWNESKRSKLKSSVKSVFDLELAAMMTSRSLSASAFLAAAILLVGTASAREAAPAATIAATPAKPKPLDLTPPDITRIFTADQIGRALAGSLKDDIEEIEVEGVRERMLPNTPTVWGGIAAPFWAMIHPAQAWRIFAPLPPDQTRRLASARFDATVDYLQPAAMPVCDYCIDSR